MKKIILFLIPFLFIEVGFAQEWSTKLYVEDYPYIYVSDSSIRFKNYEQVIGDPYRFYSQHVTYLLPNGNTLTINSYRDSIVYVSECDSSNSFIQGGEMKVDYSQNIYERFNCMDQYGKDSICNQIYHPLVKDGDWSISIQKHLMYLSSKHGMGETVKEEVIILGKHQITIPSSQYSYNQKTNDYLFQLGSKKQVESLIEGQWYHHSHYNYDPNSMILSRDENSITPHRGYTHSLFEPSGKYIGKRTIPCGVGVGEDYYNPIGKWRLTNDNKLEFLEIEWSILYIDEESMILMHEE